MGIEKIFLHVFNVSVTAGWIVLAVLLLRGVLRKAPKWLHCLLWGVVVIRLVMPFSIESVLSLVPSAETLPPDIIITNIPTINTGIPTINSAINPIISEALTVVPESGVNPTQIILSVAAAVWLVGLAAMAAYGILSYIRVRMKVRVSMSGERGIYYCDGIDSPFILGIIRPRIYLPSGIDAEAVEYVLKHERTHLHRRDHLWKPLGFVLLTAYWFNPLLWVAYIVFCRDIEKACDEKVIRNMSDEDKKGYSRALLNCSSAQRRLIMACPLAFGEVGVKNRIKSVLNYKKPAFWIIAIAIVSLIVTSVCFLTNPPKDDKGDDLPKYDVNSPSVDLFGDAPTRTLSELKARCPQLFGLDTSEGLRVTAWPAGNDRYYCSLFDGKVSLENYDAVWSGPFVTTAEMKLILDHYNLPEGHVSLATPPQAREYYWPNIHEIVSAKLGRSLTPNFVRGLIYDDMAAFDIDHDGVNELCIIAPGFTSGVDSYYLLVNEIETCELKKYGAMSGPVQRFVEYNGKTYFEYIHYEYTTSDIEGLKKEIHLASGILDISEIKGYGWSAFFSEVIVFEDSVFVRDICETGPKLTVKFEGKSKQTGYSYDLQSVSLILNNAYGVLSQEVRPMEEALITLEYRDENDVPKGSIYIFENDMISSDQLTEKGICKLVKCNVLSDYACETVRLFMETEYMEYMGVPIYNGGIHYNGEKRDGSSITYYSVLSDDDIRYVMDCLGKAPLSYSDESTKGLKDPVFKIEIQLSDKSKLLILLLIRVFIFSSKLSSSFWWRMRNSAAAVGVFTRVWAMRSMMVSSLSCPMPVMMGRGNWAMFSASSSVSKPLRSDVAPPPRMMITASQSSKCSAMALREAMMLGVTSFPCMVAWNSCILNANPSGLFFSWLQKSS